MFEIYIKSIDIEYHVECAYDRLTIFEGSDEDSPVIHIYCNGNNEPVQAAFMNITSTSRHVTLFFETDSASTGNGFHIDYEFVSQGQLFVCYLNNVLIRLWLC